MNKLFTKIATSFVGIAMAVGVGVAIGNYRDVSPAYAETATDAFVFTDKNYNGTLNGTAYTLSSTLTSVTSGNGFTSGQGIQHTKGGSSGATTVTSYSKVTKITVYYCTNSKAGAGTIGFKVGDGTRQIFAVNKPSSGGTTQKTADFTFNEETGVVTVDCSATANSVYLYGFTVTYDSGSEPAKTVTGLEVLDDSAVELNDGDERSLVATGTFASAEVTCEVSYDDESTNDDVSITSSPTSGFSVGESDKGTFTMSFTENGDFAVTIEANDDNNYAITVTYHVSGITNVDYVLYTESTLIKGDYVITDSKANVALKNTTTSAPRIGHESVAPVNNKISNPDSSIVWHIAADGDYLTIYNAAANKYAAFTSSDGRGTLINPVTDYAKWEYDGEGDFTNVGKTGKYLRYNSGYGFASYSSSTGSSLNLYKRSVAITSIAIKTAPTKVAYSETECFDPTGLVITATYADETTADIPYSDNSGFSFNPTLSTPLTTSVNSVEITYGGKTANQAITVSSAVAVSSVTLNKETTTIARGETEKLTVTVLPDDATNKNVTWESSDTSIATVDDGVVTAVSKGTAVITVTSVADNTKTDTCTVTVTAPLYESNMSNFDWSEFDTGVVAADKTLIDSTGVQGKSLSWNISAGERFGTGTETYVLGDYNSQYGNAATFKATDNYAGIVAGLEQNEIGNFNKYYAFYTRNFGIVNLTSATFSWELAKNVVTSIRILASDDGGVNWTLLKTQEVTSNAGGSISWNGSTYQNNKTVEIALVITSQSIAGASSSAPQIRNVSWELNGDSIDQSPVWNAAKIGISGDDNVEMGSTATLSVTKAPSFAVNPTVSWESSNTSVATVNESTGTVTPVSVGTVTITATTSQGVTASKSIEVVSAYVHVASVELNKESTTISQAGSETLIATVTGVGGETPTDPSVSWSSSDESIATVDENGKISVLSTASVEDKVTITVTTTDGGYTDTCVVTVSQFDAPYHLITDESEIHAGMTVVFGYKGTTSSKVSLGLGTGKFITVGDATIIGESLDAESLMTYTIGGTVGSWTFTSEEGLLGTTAVKTMNHTGEGTSTWSISIDSSNGEASISSTNSNLGQIFYNISSPRFLNYASQGSMGMPSLYAIDSEDNVLEFIRHNMRMGDNELNTEEYIGKCSSSGEGYYLNAKKALSLLSENERNAFMNNSGSKYTAALERYNAWAKACGDATPFDGKTNISSRIVLFGLNSEATNNILPIIIISAISIAAVGGYFLLHKKKED